MALLGVSGPGSPSRWQTSCCSHLKAQQGPERMCFQVLACTPFLASVLCLLLARSHNILTTWLLVFLRARDLRARGREWAPKRKTPLFMTSLGSDILFLPYAFGHTDNAGTGRYILTSLYSPDIQGVNNRRCGLSGGILEAGYHSGSEGPNCLWASLSEGPTSYMKCYFRAAYNSNYFCPNWP